jgi:DNA polymerase elongation subunit (family B)
MSYISAIWTGENVIVWERNEADERVEQIYRAPYYYYENDEDGSYETIYNTKVKKVQFSSSSAYKKAKKDLAEKGQHAWESDISPEMRVLSNHYYDLPAPKLHTTFYDIEVNYDPDIGFSSIDNPYAPINSIALYHSWSKELIIICVPPEDGWTEERLFETCNEIEPIPSEYKTSFILCKDERELLLHFILAIEDSDVICGWNCVPLTQTVWAQDCITTLDKVPKNLYDSSILSISPTQKKTEWITTLVNGLTIRSSGDHRFYFKSVLKNKYTNLQNKIVKDVELSPKEAIEQEDVLFAELPLRNNKQPNVESYSNEQLYLAGLIYTDGTLKKNTDPSAGFQVYQSDYDMLGKLPLVTTAIIGPHKNCYSRGIKWSLIKSVYHLIFDTTTNKKKLNITELSKLSYSQFMSFISGLLDGDGYVSTGNIEWCNYNDDVDTLFELCLWNGIYCIIRPNTLRFMHINYDDLSLLKTSRWENFTPSNLKRNSKQKAQQLNYRIFDNRVFVRVKQIQETSNKVDMIDLQTSNHHFYTKGVKVHNSDMFDTPYTGKRLEFHFGKNAVRKLDFQGAEPRWREIQARTTGKVIGTTLDLKGRVNLDYMLLFKKYEPSERASYKLSSIEEEVDLGLPKMKYDGTLHDLYYQNFAFFIRYNIRDTEILNGFEQKLGYVDLANQMVHISCGLFSHVLGTLKLAEYATINYCHYKLKQVVRDFIPTSKEFDRQIEGAYVLDPDIGMHEWIGSIDINSLYPSAIRSNNISPETLRGQFNEAEGACDAISKGASTSLTLELENGQRIEKTAFEFREWLQDRKWGISGFGTVFDQNKKGIIPTILEDWYSTRKQYQKLKYEAETAGDQNKADYYDRLQYVYKIKLNSFYGALTNLYFRFYDIRMGESTTGTGRMILRHQCSKVNEILDGTYQLEGEGVIYGDTDSSYFRTFADNKEDAIMIADAVADKVNASYQKFMQDVFLCQPGFDNIIKCGRELVSDRGIFVEKKRYILHVVDQEGTSVDKMKVMGLDTKKTSLPKHIATALNGFIERLLKGEDWTSVAESVVEYKDQLRALAEKNITILGLPKGISSVEYFYDEKQFLLYAKKHKTTGRTNISGHVRAALHYNHSLKKYDDKISFPIKDGMKIRIFYLIGKFEPYILLNGEQLNFDSIALPTDIEVVPQWFFDNITVDIDAHITRLVDNPLKNILKAIGKEPPNKQSLFINSVLIF